MNRTALHKVAIERNLQTVLGNQAMVETLTFHGSTHSFKEELANSISHGVGLIVAIAAVPVLIVAAVQRGDAVGIVSASIFAATLVSLYLVSTLYHALPDGKSKRVFRILDHSAIFFLIAGTYTPFTLGVLRGAWGWTLFGIVWGMTLAGVTLKIIGGTRYPGFFIAWYLVMGWIVLVAIKPLWLSVSSWGLFWLLAGGIAYTIGVVFFAASRIRHGHFVWHLFVIAGSACHFIAVFRYAV